MVSLRPGKPSRHTILRSVRRQAREGVVGMSHYTVTAERGSSNVWVFQCREFPGAISEGKTLASAYDLMPEAIAFVAEVDEASVEIDLVPDRPQDVIVEGLRTVCEVRSRAGAAPDRRGRASPARSEGLA